jgi:cyclophilin family peptidyl-prolyl cis-trans isomerase
VKLWLPAWLPACLSLVIFSLASIIFSPAINPSFDRFGPGPHQVEITVAFDPEFPKEKDTDENMARILIEMAPVEEMPHAVYWFLEQVSRKLYDGCSFHRNAGHVVQGGPAPNFLTPIPNPSSLNKRFKDAGFYSILFQEYSPNFPHQKYTLGFAGRPGGPDFYISTHDNSRVHGPGGQSSYEDQTEADSCFAKVVEGFDVADRMRLSPVKPGGYKAMIKNVAIVSMTIVQQQQDNSPKE